MGVAEDAVCMQEDGKNKKQRFPLSRAPSQKVFCCFLITEALNKLNNTGGGDHRSLSHTLAGPQIDTGEESA